MSSLLDDLAQQIRQQAEEIEKKDARLPEAVADDLLVRYAAMTKGMAFRFEPGDLVVQHPDLGNYRQPDKPAGIPAIVLEVHVEESNATANANAIHRPTGVIGVVCGCGCGDFDRFPAELWRFVPYAPSVGTRN